MPGPPPQYFDLLTAQTVATDGTWVDVRDYDVMSVEVSSIAGGDSIQVIGSLKKSQPTATEGSQMGSDLTVADIVQVNGPLSWLRAKKVGAASAVDVRVMGYHRAE